MNALQFSIRLSRMRKHALTHFLTLHSAWRKHLHWLALSVLTAVCGLTSLDAAAVPAFARQTGQNCLACHAGGQFPELTPYGRMFKLTGYTIGQRAKVPLAVMGVFTATAPKQNDPAAGHTQDGSLTFNTGSLFFGGKITDSVGVLAQYTYNNYAGDTGFEGHMQSDNTDFRFAQHVMSGNNDLIYGFSLNNNPGVEDVWNSSPAWGYNVVPGSTGTGSGVAPIINGALAQQAVGAGAYVYWNKTIYAELSGYRTGDGVFSFLTQGDNSVISQSYLQGTNPYLRLALTHEWGANNVMLGYTYFDVQQYENGSTGPTDHFRDNVVDFQYQYLLDPSTVTVELSNINETIDYGGYSGSTSDSVSLFRAKASYTWKAQYGTSLTYFNGSNSYNNVANVNYAGSLTQPFGNTGWTPEIYWLPVQNVRLGLQYTLFTAANSPQGLASPLKAADSNTSFLYVWTVF